MMRFEIIKGPHAGKQGNIDMVYYDYKHTGDSPDVVVGPIDNDGGYWKGTTESCRIIEETTTKGQQDKE